jgi:predicted alpha-1,6-mannanase (GH76 family)
MEHKWGSTWIGFDMGLWIALALTAYLGWRRSGWIVIAATVSATLLLVDAWFDIMTAAPGWEYLTSYLSALLVEVPLALLALWIVYREGKRYLTAPVI